MTMGAPSLLTGSSSATDSASYNTASVTPTAGALVLVLVVSGKASGLSESPTGVSQGAGGGMGALTKIGEQAVPNNNLTVTAWEGVGTGVAGVVNILHTNVMGNCAWQVIEMTSDVATPTVEQVDVFQTAALTGTQGATLSPSPDPAATVIGVLGYNAGSATTPTVGAGFTIIGTRITVNSPTIQLLSEYDATSPPAQAAFSIPATNGQAYLAIEVRDGVAAPSGYQVTIWNGTSEVPAVLTIWNGTSEVAAEVSTP